ncbi:MAG TPA: hypothetical protein PKN80_02765 [bacterium]|nr:hypothetical protein [bacterium]HNS48834.1 hypothetical protein [bacterium]
MPVRIRLRPYHPTFIVAHYGGGIPQESRARAGFESIQRKIRENPLEEIEIEIVRGHDDACESCKFRRESETGSIWGKRHTCTSAEDPHMVAEVERINNKVFGLLGLDYGSVVNLGTLVFRLSEKIPVLDDNMLGGLDKQEAYRKGLAELLARREQETGRTGK